MGCTSSAVALAGRYAVNPHLELGSGSQGRVFLAKDRRDKNRHVAVKRSPVFGEASRQALEREALIMRELDHPNICRLLDIYEKGEAIFFVMELCSGGDLADLLLQEGQLSERCTARILGQVVGGLAHAHSRGIAHRDLKPENICLCSYGTANDHVKLIDWGMSSYFNGSTMTACVGSVTYTAPEILESLVTGQRYTEACDLWSLGVVAYTVLFGKFPFWGDREELVEAAKLGQYPTSEPLWNELSEDARDFIRGLLRYEPDERLDIKAVQFHPWFLAGEGQRKPELRFAEAVQSHPWLLAGEGQPKPALRSAEAAQYHPALLTSPRLQKPGPKLWEAEPVPVGRGGLPPPAPSKPLEPWQALDEEETPSEWPRMTLAIEGSHSHCIRDGQPAATYVQGEVVSL